MPRFISCWESVPLEELVFCYLLLYTLARILGGKVLVNDRTRDAIPFRRPLHMPCTPVCTN